MKISSKQYAESLYEAVKEKKDGEIKDVIKSFVKVLAKNNDFKKAGEIICELERFIKKEEGILEAQVVTANPIKKETAKELMDWIARLSGAKKVELREEVDENVLGGVVIKYEDKIIDGSLRNKLNQLNTSFK